jgi:ribonuclease BN (tRNA processing enzyme)
MKIKILGTRGEIEDSAPYHSHHTGVLVDDKLLLDVGEKEFLKNDPEYILLSHLHPDHAYFVRGSGEKFKTDAKVYGPENHEKAEINSLKRKNEIGPYKIIAVPTIHSIKVESYAYVIQKRSRKLLYTGDMIWIEKKYHRYLQDLDLVISEGSFIQKKGLVRRKEDSGKIYGHQGVPDLINLFKDFTDNIVFIHFGSWFYKDIKKARKKLKKLGDENDVNVITGYDGQEIDLKAF